MDKWFVNSTNGFKKIMKQLKRLNTSTTNKKLKQVKEKHHV